MCLTIYLQRVQPRHKELVWTDRTVHNSLTYVTLHHTRQRWNSSVPSFVVEHVKWISFLWNFFRKLENFILILYKSSYVSKRKNYAIQYGAILILRPFLFWPSLMGFSSLNEINRFLGFQLSRLIIWWSFKNI